MSIPPPLRKLQYVLAVARELHFRRAAERLNVSQPYISRQIKEFEADSGILLYRGCGRHVSLRMCRHDR
jgi:LysR family transcriptional regulator, cyn operon transcriptional activator